MDDAAAGRDPGRAGRGRRRLGIGCLAVLLLPVACVVVTYAVVFGGYALFALVGGTVAGVAQLFRSGGVEVDAEGAEVLLFMAALVLIVLAACAAALWGVWKGARRLVAAFRRG